MLQRHWKRLERVSQVVENRYIQYPMIFLERGETEEDIPAMIERWKAGEKVEGIFGEYEGERSEFCSHLSLLLRLRFSV